MTGWLVDFTDISIRSNSLPKPLIFNRLELSPAWGALLTGSPGASIKANWQGLEAAAKVAQDGEKISVQDIQAKADAADLVRMIETSLHLPVRIGLAGVASLEGEAVLDEHSGIPDSGYLNLHWQGAKADIMGTELVLGDLLFQLQSKDGQWQWLLRDDGEGFIRGSGIVRRQGISVTAWPLSGAITVNPAKADNPALLAWLPNQAGGGNFSLKVSGTLSRPRVDIVK